MRRLAVQVDRLIETNRVIAQRVCQTADALTRGVTPHVLGEIASALWADLTATELRLSVLDERARRRKAVLRRPRFARNKAFRSVRAQHIALLARRQDQLRERRNLVRQMGDTCAWLTLRCEPAIIVPLYSKKTHTLPTDLGGDGIILLTQAAHESGRFLVIDNDLTRCLGAGDVTVVRADGNWQLPLSIEVKTHTAAESGKLHIDLYTAVREGSAEAAMYEELKQVLSLADVPLDARATTVRAAKQLSNLMKQSQLAQQISSRVLDRARPMRSFRWRAIENVLRKAQTTGMSFDSVERGVAYVGFRNGFGPGTEQQVRAIQRRLGDFGFGDSYRHATSVDFMEQDRLGSIVPPIPLWPLARDLRARLLSGEVFYACLVDNAIWQRVFRERGVVWSLNGKGWLLQGGKNRARLGPFDVLRIRVGVMFAGVSPEEVAAVVSEMLN
jgi:hypothetical protein